MEIGRLLFRLITAENAHHTQQTNFCRRFPTRKLLRGHCRLRKFVWHLTRKRQSHFCSWSVPLVRSRRHRCLQRAKTAKCSLGRVRHFILFSSPQNRQLHRLRLLHSVRRAKLQVLHLEQRSVLDAATPGNLSSSNHRRLCCWNKRNSASPRTV